MSKIEMINIIPDMRVRGQEFKIKITFTGEICENVTKGNI